MQELADRCNELDRQLAAAAKDELRREKATTALLRRVIAELSIELDRAQALASDSAAVTHLNSRRGY